jgi:hypothetical protein
MQPVAVSVWNRMGCRSAASHAGEKMQSRCSQRRNLVHQLRPELDLPDIIPSISGPAEVIHELVLEIVPEIAAVVDDINLIDREDRSFGCAQDDRTGRE